MSAKRGVLYGFNIQLLRFGYINASEVIIAQTLGLAQNVCENLFVNLVAPRV